MLRGVLPTEDGAAVWVESDPDDRYWLQTSPRARQVVLQGGMEVIDSQAERIADEIISLVHGDVDASPSL
jgi:hypothetical protein